MTNFVMKMHFVKNNTNNQKITNKIMTNIKPTNIKQQNIKQQNIKQQNIKPINVIKLRNRTIYSHSLFNTMFLSSGNGGCGCGR